MKSSFRTCRITDKAPFENMTKEATDNIPNHFKKMAKNITDDFKC